MRSLIVIEVEHGEDTDPVQAMVEDFTSDPDYFGNGSLMITDSAVRIDLPFFFRLEN